MISAFFKAVVRYHRGLARMPLSWKPWLFSLLGANMIAPLFWFDRFEAKVVFCVALLNFVTFVFLTAVSGFSRLLGLAHVYWIPLVCFLWMRLDMFPVSTAYGFWIRTVIVLNTGSVILDAANVFRYIRGERQELVKGL